MDDSNPLTSESGETDAEGPSPLIPQA